MSIDQIVVVRAKTRLEELVERFNSKAQAKFYIERSGGNFEGYIKEHDRFYTSLRTLMDQVKSHGKHKVIDRSFLPTLIFSPTDLVVVIGQDGLVANTAKYVNGLPILAFNPDPENYDGILLPFQAGDSKSMLEKMAQNQFSTKQITMAEAKLSDGQRMLAFNDFYIGARSHVSSRYLLEYDGKVERQSSSGIIVSTGAGSTGWLSSVFNMVNGINKFYDYQVALNESLAWDDQQLFFTVREPFQSVVTTTDLCFGRIHQHNPLKIESLMSDNGVIFSDGVEADAIKFNSGTTVEIGIAKERANLVVQ